MEIFITFLLSLLALEVVITYIWGLRVAFDAVVANGGVIGEDLSNPEFWLFTLCVLTSPISIPCSIAIEIYKNGL